MPFRSLKCHAGSNGEKKKNRRLMAGQRRQESNVFESGGGVDKGRGDRLIWKLAIDSKEASTDDEVRVDTRAAEKYKMCGSQVEMNDKQLAG